MIHARNARPHPTLETDHGDDWRDKAACVGLDPDLFTIPEGQSWTSAWGKGRAELARSVCVGRGCPVVAACLADANEMGDDWTFRGGMTPDERKAIRRKPRGPRAQTVCAQGHDVSTDESRYANGKCKKCALKRALKQRERKAS